MSETLSPDAVLPKGEFAALIGVSPGRVSQLIAEGKIGPDALVGDGRAARIRVDLARRQILARRDVGQALGNGLMTRLGTASPAPIIDVPAQPAPRVDSVEEQIKRERLRSSQFANRKAAEEEEARKGRFTDTVEARAQMARLASAILQGVEGALPEIADAIAAQFQVPKRDVEHLLQTRFRAVRQAAAERHRSQASRLPEIFERVVAADDVEPA